MFLYCSRSDRNFGESASISQRRVLAIGYYSAIGGDVLPGDPTPSSTDQESDDFAISSGCPKRRRRVISSKP
jgi:hypothetical protein